ncbi:MAG TPA: hypothetical protein VJ276_26800 [Thermoanaerobaculia bacterium]|nr:hypothetical protein [Thermoanaerobaculia bacterium]
MNRWMVRIAGILMILMFLLMFFFLQRQLEQLQRERGMATTTATSRT